MKLTHPSTMLVSGPTGCGKTQFVVRLILEEMFYPKPQRIIWFYSEWQPLYDHLQSIKSNIEFEKELTQTIYTSLDSKVRNLIILDDQMSKVGDNVLLSQLFTEGSHHRNLTVIYLVQNLFDKGKCQRTVNLNSNYKVLFKNPQDKSQIKIIADRAFPDQKEYFMKSFKDATKESYGYLLLDMHPKTPEEYRVITNIFDPISPDYYIAQ